MDHHLTVREKNVIKILHFVLRTSPLNEPWRRHFVSVWFSGLGGEPCIDIGGGGGLPGLTAEGRGLLPCHGGGHVRDAAGKDATSRIACHLELANVLVISSC